VTIFVTTHFMNEGMRCDRISLMNAGKVLACDAPQKLIETRGAASLEDAFIGYMEDAIASAAAGSESKEKAPASAPPAPPRNRPTPPTPPEQRPAGSAPAGCLPTPPTNDADPPRPGATGLCLCGSALLMLVFGFGITTDVEHIRYASFDLDQSPESRTYLEQFAASSRYFTRTPPVSSAEEALRRLQSDDISLCLKSRRISAGISQGLQPGCLAQVDGANTFRGETVAQYAQGVHDKMLRDPGRAACTPA
jgi:ribosome-dependent ATPase